MTAPQAQSPASAQTTTWISIVMQSAAFGLAAFAPKVQAYAVAHPTAAFAVGGFASVLAHFLQSPTQPSGQ
jgi:hypothetical protein